MPHFTFSPTPNPNSLKITTDGDPFIEGGMATFSGAAEAEGHPIGQPLFAIAGVANIFILPQFLTVTKTPASDWDNILPTVETILQTYFLGRTG